MSRFCPLLCLALAGCGLPSSDVADTARSRLVGLSELALHLCAGFPTHAETVDGVRLETYETQLAPPNLTVNLPNLGPLGGGGFGLSAGDASYCRATFALVDGRVTEVRYSGATGAGLGALTRCGPIVEHCVKDGPPATALAPKSQG